MNNILIISQDGINVIPTIIGQGYRQEIKIIGDKLEDIMLKKKMSTDELINKVGNSYRNNIERILKNEEIPTPKIIEKLTKIFEVNEDFFKDRELKNVVCVQGGIVIGKYDTNERAEQVVKEVQNKQKEAILNNQSSIYIMPKK